MLTLEMPASNAPQFLCPECASTLINHLMDTDFRSMLIGDGQLTLRSDNPSEGEALMALLSRRRF